LLNISLDLPSLNFSIMELIVFAALIIIGILILVFLIKLVFMFIPAAIIAFIVWFLTGSLYYAGIAFLIIAVIAIIRKI
jgi:hypothetical protein